MTIELFDVAPEDPVRNWPAYNAVNLDKVDSLIGTIGPTVYNPVLSATSGTQPNVGADGSVTGFWYKILDMIFVWGIVHWAGAGLEPGDDGWLRVSLPVAVLGLPTSINIGVGAVIGQAHCRDNSNTSGNSQPGVVQAQSATTVSFSSTKGNASGAWRHDVPFVWAAGDRISWSACYRAALI